MIKILSSLTRKDWVTILIVAFGYFVDLYDLLLFSAVRKASLLALNVPEAQLADVGVSLLNWQLIGLLVGGLFWGVLSDKKGRLATLVASILMYSTATLANAWVSSIEMYIVLRIIAGIGLAGELGIGITLISESLSKEKRTVATMLVSTIGMFGAVTAAIVSMVVDWRTAYIVGGLMGFALLLLRVNVTESVMYQNVSKRQDVSRGNIFQLFGNAKLLAKYTWCVLVGSPIFIFIGVYVGLSPEFGKALGEPNVQASVSIIVLYVSISLGDILGSYISKQMQSRKNPLAIALTAQTFGLILFFFTPILFYVKISLLGIGIGLSWAVLITNAAEQFGTNLRGTVATSVPNFVRGVSIPMTELLFKPLKNSIDILTAGEIVGFIAITIGYIAVYMLKDNFENETDFVE